MCFYVFLRHSRCLFTFSTWLVWVSVANQYSFLSLVLLTNVTSTYCNIKHIASTEIFKLCVEGSCIFHITIIIAEKNKIYQCHYFSNVVQPYLIWIWGKLLKNQTESRGDWQVRSLDRHWSKHAVEAVFYVTNNTFSVGARYSKK